MEEILSTILIFFLISIWVIGYAYLRAEQEVNAYENKYKEFKEKSEQK